MPKPTVYEDIAKQLHRENWARCTGRPGPQPVPVAEQLERRKVTALERIADALEARNRENHYLMVFHGKYKYLYAQLVQKAKEAEAERDAKTLIIEPFLNWKGGPE